MCLQIKLSSKAVALNLPTAATFEISSSCFGDPPPTPNLKTIFIATS